MSVTAVLEKLAEQRADHLPCVQCKTLATRKTLSQCGGLCTGRFTAYCAGGIRALDQRRAA